MWVPAEIKDPVWQHAPTRKSVACFGAVSLRSGKYVRAMCGVFNAETFEAFLKKLLRHRARGASTAPCCRCSSSHPTAHNWHRSSGFGNSPADSPRTTDISPPSPKCSTPSAPASTDGACPIQCCGDYAALFKTLCLVPAEARGRAREKAGALAATSISVQIGRAHV